MKRTNGALLTFGVLVAVLVAAFAGHRVLASRQAAQEQAAVADDASMTADRVALLADYDATVYTADGTSVLLSELANGKPLVINFWATWCPYCVDELPDFQQIVAEYGDRVSFAFVDAADGQRERVDDAAAWLVEQGFDDLPVYYDTAQEAITAFGAYSLPTTILVNAEGEIVSASAGRIDAALMRGALQQLV